MRLFSNFGCKLHKFLIYFNGQTIAWVLILMTVERFVTICFPYQTIISITKKKIAYVLLLLTLFSACLTSHFWWTVSLFEQTSRVAYNFLVTTPVDTILVSEMANFTKLYENEASSYITTTKLVCTIGDSKYNEFIYQYWPWINLAVYSLIPFFIISTSNLFLLIRLIYSVYERKRNLGQVANSFKIGGSSLLLISAGLFKGHYGG